MLNKLVRSEKTTENLHILGESKENMKNIKGMQDTYSKEYDNNLKISKIHHKRK